jgi:hypothetical protein
MAFNKRYFLELGAAVRFTQFSWLPISISFTTVWRSGKNYPIWKVMWSWKSPSQRSVGASTPAKEDKAADLF